MMMLYARNSEHHTQKPSENPCDVLESRTAQTDISDEQSRKERLAGDEQSSGVNEDKKKCGTGMKA